MSNIFYKEYTKHNNLANCYKKCEKRNNYNYFELIDISKELHISASRINGMAKYENTTFKKLLFFDYDKFLSSLPHSLSEGKRRCDAIIYTIEEKTYFILNELKDRDNTSSKKRRAIRYDAKDQLKHTLNELFSVPEINNFINLFSHKICISSNAQPTPPEPLISSVIASFNPLSNITPNGLNLPDTEINSYGFEYWDLIGEQTYKIL